MTERENELALTAQEWLLRRQEAVPYRAPRRVFVRMQKPDEKKYRDQWDELFESFMRGETQCQSA